MGRAERGVQALGGAVLASRVEGLGLSVNPPPGAGQRAGAGCPAAAMLNRPGHRARIERAADHQGYGSRV